MFARVTTFEGPPEQLEAGVRMFREQVLPWLRDASGFRGWIVLLDREHARSLGITFWATEQNAVDAPSSGSILRENVAASVGVQMHSLDIYELALAEALALDEPA